MTKLVFGCGYLGQRVASRWLELGHEVYAVTRSHDRAAGFRDSGLRPIVANLTDPSGLIDLPDAETVLIAVGFDRTAAQTIHDVYVDGLRNVLEAVPKSVRRIIYISSTGVYGQKDGSWVDENSPCQPLREGGKACLAAEQLLAGHPLGRHANVLRMAGIYGPGRVPSRKNPAASIPAAATDGYLNLIHVDDAVEIIVAVELRAPRPRTFVVSDGTPVRRQDYYQVIHELFGIGSPSAIDSRSDSNRADRAASDKRVCNQRLVAELAPCWKYPSYREGLAAISALANQSS